MTRAEEIRKKNKERNDRIKKLYHGSRLCDNREYEVETLNPFGHWSSVRWYFENQKDAEAFALNETTDRARVIKLNWLDAHTLETEVVFNK